MDKPNINKLKENGDIEGLIRAFDISFSMNQSVSEKASDALVKIGEPAVEPLIKALKDKDLFVQHNAALTLGLIALKGIKDVRAIEPLIQALKDKTFIVRESAATALGAIGGEKAVEPLIQTLKDKEERVRKAATVGLGLIGNAKAIDAITAVMNNTNEDEDVRKNAAAVLKKLMAKKKK
jgi:vesicle coat complex subunit